MSKKIHIQPKYFIADAEVLSFVFNLSKIAATIAFYQRFKTQKLAGKQYPWFKSYKNRFNPTDEIDSLTRPRATHTRPTSSTSEDPSPRVVHIRQLSSTTEEPPPSESRRSSDFYLEPEESDRPDSMHKSIYSEPEQRDRPDSAPKSIYSRNSMYSRNSGYSTQPDFNIRRVAAVKGLPEDDQAGKLVSFLWWSCFLLARILAISTFFYFYVTSTTYIFTFQFVVFVSCLYYT